jgi:putrescine transport system substrate-binding protein
MQRTALAASAAIGALILAAGAAVAQEDVVNVYNWSDYVDEEVLTEFTDETGIKVVYDVYDSVDIAETKLLAGGSGYDIVAPSEANVARLIQAGALQKLDKSKLPNLVNMWPELMQRLEAYDPGNEYAVMYMWGTSGIGYNASMIAERMADAPTDSWAMLFDPEVVSKFADCGIHVLDAADELIPAALNYLGLSPVSTDTGDIEKAAALLASIKPYVQKFHSSEYINALANGDICLAMGYSGDILQARDRAAEADDGVEVVYLIPKEGARIWFDSFIIPADAPHPDAAHTFINFMMEPEVAAANTNYVFYANANKASQPLIDPEVIEDPAIYPPESTVQRLFTVLPYDSRTQRLITREWTRVKSGG